MASQSPARPDETSLIDFALPATDGRTYALPDIKGANGTLLMFICNHCPYVKAVITRLNEDCRALEAAGIGAAAIMSNDAAAYPADSFENMKRFTAEHALVFPYLLDETQNVARAYGAACTPDLFGFDRDGGLKYRGRVDSAGARPPSGEEKRELREAMLLIARTGDGPAEQFPSVGCSIKWRR